MSEADSIRKRISDKSRRLQKFKEQEALLGISTDPAILIQIEDLEAQLEELQAQLKALESGASARMSSIAPSSSPADGASPSSFRQIKIKSLQQRREDLFAEFEAANKQLRNALSEVERTRLKRQLKSLEVEIEEVESELSSLR
jgi:archaellum component FlaC